MEYINVDLKKYFNSLSQILMFYGQLVRLCNSTIDVLFWQKQTILKWVVLKQVE